MHMEEVVSLNVVALMYSDSSCCSNFGVPYPFMAYKVLYITALFAS